MLKKTLNSLIKWLNMNSITLELDIVYESENATISRLLIGKEEFYILENGHRDPKVWGNTRIPAGIYTVIKRNFGRFFELYSSRYEHKFVYEIEKVPNFSGILFHIGNFVNNTDGCLLVGTSPALINGELSVVSSINAYKRFYNALEKYQLISIKINRIFKNRV